MPRRHMHLRVADGARLRAGFAALRADLRLPDGFPREVLAEAAGAAAAGPRFTGHDATDLPFVTIDPADSTDLDQAMHLARHGSGYRVHYAIADVAAWVAPDGAIDAEAMRRVETLYLPDGRIPLHPAELSEAAASLLPGQDRPALLWTLDLDAHGELVGTDVRRAVVRSRRRFDYTEVQRALDAGTAEEPLALLREIGLLREEIERDRGGVSLPIPEQEIVQTGDTWALAFRAPIAAEGWNAQISLLTGMAAADLMTYAGVGVLRTLPDAPTTALAQMRRVAKALDVDWPDGATYGEVIHALDPALPHHAAFLQEATGLLRGAGYTAFDGGVPELATHAAVADEYAHVTAPLRRLVDRFAGEVCVSVVAGDDVPAWVLGRLPELPKAMESGDRKAHEVEREAVDLVEAAVLEPHVGEEFDAVVVDLNDRGDAGTVQLRTPAVRAKFTGTGLKLGSAVRVRLTEADLAERRVRFAPA
ncbi:RNB domain-containing ribonuclease [Yinghuangia seranimata]|uniref:RNB domain-containing ribonuclease n=1 Tax=Yinghuangia seranimata TaxID=408067 RepID=UPI00248AEDA7|nr:RNB domain-containing ribonuclease [Yinghuangia seranimata]MDI2128592.1 RNB domain-containing ribonuclease [Yinghuangia seranimata]